MKTDSSVQQLGFCCTGPLSDMEDMAYHNYNEEPPKIVLVIIVNIRPP